MGTDELIALILTLPEVRQAAPADTPEFRVAGRLFASLSAQGDLVLRLTADQQRQVMHSDPRIFSLADGGWGTRGWTHAALAELDEAAALSALFMAWGNAAPDRSAESSNT